jgi:hypothetical protein
MEKIRENYFIGCMIITTLISCNNYKQKTFLDFELGMSYKEFINHANKLEQSGFISKLNNTDFDYTIKLQDNSYAFFHVHCYVYPNSRLSMIIGNCKYNLNDTEKEQLYNVFVSKHGQTTEPFKKANSTNIWRAVWDKDDIDTRLVFVDEDKDGKWETSLNFMATGNLGDNIENKEKKENGLIDVENKY